MPAKLLAEFQEQLKSAAALLSPPVELEFKSMFGGMCAYCGENVFASLSDVGLALKLAPSDQEELLAHQGAARLRYDAKAPPSKQYILLPPQLRKEPEELMPWMQRSLEFVRHLPRTKPKKTKEPKPS